MSTIQGGYEGGWNGTSMAAPHVTGAVALVWGKYPDLTWQQVRTRVLEGRSTLSSLTGKCTTGGAFRIDHPLDPENKELWHSFVESPDMMNIYNGNVLTDSAGYATIEMPEYFNALNSDFRYQLTVIDDADSDHFVMAKVVREVEGNQFTIRTSVPFTRVSWMVTGIRQDAFAQANRIPNEVEKLTGDRGLYLHPEAFGQPAHKGVDWKHSPEGMEQHKASLLAEQAAQRP